MNALTEFFQPLLEFFQQEGLYWKLGLVLLVPLLVIVLGEVLDRLKQGRNPLVRGVRMIRDVVLPLLAVLLTMRYILNITTRPLHIVETVFWGSIIVAGLTLLNNLGRMKEERPTSNWARAPQLLFTLGRVLVVVLVTMHVLNDVWQVELASWGTSLGIGGAVVALTLQDTFGQLFSGFLLLADRPFKVGDWIRYDQKWMQVVEINWRAVRLQGPDRTTTVVPNSVLGGESIQNAGSADAAYQVVLPISFYDEDPPNVVKQVLLEILTTAEGVLHQPPPQVVTTDYGAFQISYEMKFFVRFRDFPQMRDCILTRVYYAAKRHQLTTSPVELKNDPGYESAPREEVQGSVADDLRALALFESLDDATIAGLAQDAAVRNYGAGERIVSQGEPCSYLSIIKHGSAELAAADTTGEEKKISRLRPADLFGELSLLNDEPSPVSVAAAEDSQVLAIHREPIRLLIEAHPRFAMQLNEFVEAREKAVSELTGREDAISRPLGRDRWLEMFRRDAPGSFAETNEA